MLGIMLVLAVGGFFLWYQARSAPKWYQPADPDAPEVAALAERVEYGLVEAYHKIRPEGDPWQVKVRDEEVNAWLATRMPEWIAHDEQTEWPSEFGTPQIDIGPEGINVAVEVQLGDRKQVLVSRLTPQFSDGQMQFKIDRVGLGRLAIPGVAATKLLNMVDEIAPGGVLDADIAQKLMSKAGGMGGMSDADGLSPDLELGDGRIVELLNMRLQDGAIDLTNRTLLPNGRP